MKKVKKSTAVPVGYHAQRYALHPTEVVKGHSYRDRSTVCFTPSLGSIPVRVIQSWNQLIKPMNQKFTQIFLVDQEVGKAYEQAVDILRNNPELKKWRYVLFLEHDNCPEPDGLMKLYEDIENNPKFDAVGGLYFTKGEMGQPMCYGRTDVEPKDFQPWLPPLNTVTQCHGLGMGFTLIKTKVLLDERFERPLFKTEQEYVRGKGTTLYTQDLRFYQNMGKLGYKVACSTRVSVGHFDAAEDRMW